MRLICTLLLLLPFIAHAQQRIGINTTTPTTDVDIRSFNDTTDWIELQLANPAGNHFLRLSGGRGFDPRPGISFNRTDTFRISSSNPDYSMFRERITLFPDGKMGLDYLYPKRRLHARGDGIFTEGTSIGMAADTGTLTLIDEEFRQLSMDGEKIQTFNIDDMAASLLYIQPYGGNINFGSGDIILNNATSEVEFTGNVRMSTLSGIGDRNIVVDPLGYVKLGPGGSDTDWQTGSGAIYNTTDKVGIGFTSPSAQFQVYGPESNLNNAVVKFVSPTAPIGADTMYFDGNEIDVVSSGLSFPKLELQRNSPGHIEMVQGGGNVGIGTGAPLKRKLIVSGLEIPVEGDLSELAATFSIINIGQEFDELVMDGNEIHSVDNDLFINSKTPHNVSVAAGGGNVSIGTNTMATGYRLSVDGGIIGEEVRVQYTSMWPDYVFEPDYKLLSLADLESKIEFLGHLPGVPSASDVAQEGIDLGSMDALLLEKVEELTLHMIELNKRVAELEKENAALKTNK